MIFTTARLGTPSLGPRREGASTVLLRFEDASGKGSYNLIKIILQFSLDNLRVRHCRSIRLLVD